VQNRSRFSGMLASIGLWPRSLRERPDRLGARAGGRGRGRPRAHDRPPGPC